jgi:SAM-dependent methyltransferase
MKVTKLLRQVQFAWIAANERYLNIETSDRVQYEETPGWWRGPKTSAARHQDNCAYGTPDYFYVYKIIKVLNPQPDDVIYDIGAGKGRILCVMSRRHVRKCVGIELLDDLCQTARANAARVRGRRAPIEIRCEDAAVADISDGTIYFLFNPFGKDTMQEVLAHIERSLALHPRRVRVVYYNSVCREVFDSCGWLRRTSAFRTFNGLEIAFYESQLQPQSAVTA